MLCLCLSVLAGRAQVTIQVGLNFTGSSYITNSQALPPDPNGVIGPTRFMEFVNGSVAVYNRTNGLSVQRKSDLKFWADAGLNTSAIGVSDPRVIYDPNTQRWFATQVDFDPNAGDPTTEANDFLLAVSLTSSPNGPWQGSPASSLSGARATSPLAAHAGASGSEPPVTRRVWFALAGSLRQSGSS